MLMHAVDRYLAIRRAAGFALVPIEAYLRHFARFATEHGETHVVARTAIAWATLAPSEAQRHYRLQTVIRFARFMAAEDPGHEIPPGGVFRGSRPRPIPYIFSDDEIQQLLAHAQRLGPPGSLRPQTYSTLFGLLAVTGMRVAEALALHCTDVTLDGLCIRHTKFKKSRLLPLHATTRVALEHYLAQRRCVAGLEAHLFVSRRHGPLSRTVVTQTFHQALTAAGIPFTPGRRRPRLIDLRHTFAVRTLEEGPETREHVGRHMLALTTYMGHTCVASTYWYLESTPRLMLDIAKTCEAFIHGETV
ncbi:MAG TPA: tyrosine-type recombinase/integrase [Candidatus Tectomicrobia bacterium]